MNESMKKLQRWLPPDQTGIYSPKYSQFKVDFSCVNVSGSSVQTTRDTNLSQLMWGES